MGALDSVADQAFSHTGLRGSFSTERTLEIDAYCIVATMAYALMSITYF
jgi:hypothetical protein